MVALVLIAPRDTNTDNVVNVYSFILVRLLLKWCY